MDLWKVRVVHHRHQVERVMGEDKRQPSQSRNHSVTQRGALDKIGALRHGEEFSQESRGLRKLCGTRLLRNMTH